MTRQVKVTRILHSQGLNASKYSRLSEMAVLCGCVRADAWRRCSGLSTILQSPYDVRDDWMAEGCDWHGLPARLGKALLVERTRLSVGTAPPGLELRGPATTLPSTESELPQTSWV